MKLFKKFLSVIVVASMLLPNLAMAEDKLGVSALLSPPVTPSNEKDPGAAISPMRKGQVASFTGLLLSPAAIASIIVDYKDAEAKTAIEVEKAVGNITAKHDFDTKEAAAAATADKKIMQADIDQKLARIKSLESAAVDPPSRTLWAGLGAIGGAAFAILTVFVVAQVTK